MWKWYPQHLPLVWRRGSDNPYGWSSLALKWPIYFLYFNAWVKPIIMIPCFGNVMHCFASFYWLSISFFHHSPILADSKLIDHVNKYFQYHSEIHLSKFPFLFVIWFHAQTWNTLILTCNAQIFVIDKSCYKPSFHQHVILLIIVGQPWADQIWISLLRPVWNSKLCLSKNFFIISVMKFDKHVPRMHHHELFAWSQLRCPFSYILQITNYILTMLCNSIFPTLYKSFWLLMQNMGNMTIVFLFSFCY